MMSESLWKRKRRTPTQSIQKWSSIAYKLTKNGECLVSCRIGSGMYMKHKDLR